MDWWYSGIHDYGTTGSFGRICLRLIAGWKQRTFWQYIRKGQAEAGNYDEGQRNSFYSPCWLWRLTSSVQTDASCTAKWNMYANS